MEDAPKADGFEWGFTALPAVKEGGERASYTFFAEQIWMPAEAKSRISEKNLSLTCTLMKQLRSSSIKAEQFSRSKNV